MEANFADFYRVSGLRGVYLASQLADGVTEDSLRPSNLTTVISFNSGATWQPVQGPKTDHEGNPVLGCYQVRALLFFCESFLSLIYSGQNALLNRVEQIVTLKKSSL